MCNNESGYVRFANVDQMHPDPVTAFLHNLFSSDWQKEKYEVILSIVTPKCGLLVSR